MIECGSSHGGMLGSYITLFLYPPYEKHLAIPIAPSASILSASYTINPSTNSLSFIIFFSLFIPPLYEMFSIIIFIFSFYTSLNSSFKLSKNTSTFFIVYSFLSVNFQSSISCNNAANFITISSITTLFLFYFSSLYIILLNL